MAQPRLLLIDDEPALAEFLANAAVEAGFVWINEVARHFLGAPFGFGEVTGHIQPAELAAHFHAEGAPARFGNLTP